MLNVCKSLITDIGSMGQKALAYLDLEPGRPFGDMFCHLIITIRGPIRQPIAVAVPGFLQTIVFRMEYFDFIDFMTTPLCRLV